MSSHSYIANSTHVIYTVYVKSLQVAAKVSKKEAKNMAVKESHHIVKGGAQSISSPNVSLPESHSSSYDEYKNKLETHRCILEQELTAENYKEKFHLLLSWEEQEHAKQLAERYCQS